MKDRSEIKKEELAHLKSLYTSNPELFEQRTFIDNSNILRGVGIDLPNKDYYPLGYLKLWPQDFIVEEISPTGEVYTITHENILTPASVLVNPQTTTYATLVKCGVSTIEVVLDLCKMLGCTQEDIQYAGIKDKDAITAQRISFRNVSFEKLKHIRSEHFFLKDVTFGKGIMQKSSLQGNRFTILIRTEDDFKATDKVYTFIDNLKRVKQEGFYNFYYLQRFSTPRLTNYLWALSILKGDYKKAIFDILASTGERELEYFKKLRKEIGNHFGDWAFIKNIISPFPLMFPTENKIVDYLLTKPENFIGALNEVPEQVTLWIYALSSYLFNKKISSALHNNEILPNELPLFLSFKQQDWMIYEKDLKNLDIFPPSFQNFKPFPFIQMRSRTVPIKDSVEIHTAEIIPEGIAMSFSLSKGSYATTFLSQIFNLVSGLLPEKISKEMVNTKDVLKNDSIQTTLEYFKPLLILREQNIFDIDK